MGKKHNRLNRLNLCLLLLLIISLMAASGYVFYKKESQTISLINGKLKPFDPGYIYKFYILSRPDTSNREYYGSPKASITIISYLKFESQESSHFIGDIFPKIYDEFIKTGKAKFYGKNFLTMPYFVQKGNGFLYASYLNCVKLIKQDAYYLFYFDMFKLNGTGEISRLAGKYGIPRQNMDRCLQENRFDDVMEDMLEIENFGIVGVSPRFYIGVNGADNTILEGASNYQKFNRTLRQYEFLIGN